MGVTRCRGSYSNDEELLILKGRNNARFIVIVDVCDNNAVWKFVGAIFAGECCDNVFSRLEKSSGDVCPNGTGGLVYGLIFEFIQIQLQVYVLDLLQQWRLSQSHY